MGRFSNCGWMGRHVKYGWVGRYVNQGWVGKNMECKRLGLVEKLVSERVYIVLC